MSVREIATVTVFQDDETGQFVAAIKRGRTPYRSTAFSTRRGLLEHVADRLGDDDPQADISHSFDRDNHAL